MDFKGIPVRTIGPASQPQEEDGASLVYIDMPKDMSTFKAPQLEDLDVAVGLDGARETIQWLQQALRNHAVESETHIANLTALDEESREVINQILGEGEVSVTCTEPMLAKSQESILAGVWRTFYFDTKHQVVCDMLEVASVPHIARTPASGAKRIDLREQQVPAGVMNALPILVELGSHLELFESCRITHAINLTLLPLSESDLQCLDDRLGRGPVDILSRAYGKCQVTSTAVPNVWWVRYYNSMNTLILNTIEIAEIPSVVQAAPEDLDASASRLEQILEPYRTDVA